MPAIGFFHQIRAGPLIYNPFNFCFPAPDILTDLVCKHYIAAAPLFRIFKQSAYTRNARTFQHIQVVLDLRYMGVLQFGAFLDFPHQLFAWIEVVDF